ncbi:TonB-dependent receptor [Celerinatantimonas sp. YJH-8]|uniref:TonB-dependent receptor n=1 Tax=Celerinatantimonas sp. YJH-8 TaxID=3228714 RepID=UPI0038C0285A
MDVFNIFKISNYSKPIIIIPILTLSSYHVTQAEEVSQLNKMVVSAHNENTNYEPPSSRFSLPQSVEATQVLTREDIEEIHPRDIMDLIENSLGFSIRRQGARVHNFSYNRGDNVSIILDGVYLTPTTAQRVLGDIPPESVESIEFLRDSSVITISPLMGFGSANAGTPNQGFILIKTRKKKPDANHSSEISSSYASYDTWKVHGFTNQDFLDKKLTVGAGYQHSTSNGKSHWNNGYQFNTYLLNGAYQAQRFSIDGSLFINKGSRDIQRSVGIYEGVPPNRNTTPKGELSSNIWRYAPMDTYVTAINTRYHWNDHQTTAITLGYSRATGTQYAYYTYSDPATVSGSKGKDWAKEWTLSHTLMYGDNIFKIGLQSVEWYQLSEGRTAPNQEHVYGASLSDEYQLTEQWVIDGALRMDKKKIIHSGTKYLEDSTRIKMAEGEWTDDAYLASIGTAWQMNPTYRFSARYSFNYTPTPDSLTTRNDTSLSAERRHRFELGARAHFSPALQLSVTPFFYYIKNRKVTDGSISVVDDDGTPNSISIYTLAPTVIRKGLELTLKGRFQLKNDNHLNYELGWSYLSDNSTNDTSDFPNNKYNARLGWRHHALQTHINVLHVASYMSNDYSVGNFTTINMTVAYDITPDITLTAFGENITDRHYSTMNKGSIKTISPSGRNAPWGLMEDIGATYGVSMSLKF